MKRCVKCDLVFHLEERSRCLYCNTLLVSLEPDEDIGEYEVFDDPAAKGSFAQKKAIITQMINDRRVKGHGRIQYIVGSYFRTRTFSFMYNFSRNEFRRGKGFSRFLIQPLNTSHFFVMPWVFINVIDSCLVRAVYNGYCPTCGWKYNKLTVNQEHNPNECEYCRDYSLVIDDILTGRITQSERIFKKRAFEALAEGKRSAYHDLCSQKKTVAMVMDVLCIWFSKTVLLSLIILLLWPLVRLIARGLDLPELYLR